MSKKYPVKNDENSETYWKELVEVEGLSHFLLDMKYEKITLT